MGPDRSVSDEEIHELGELRYRKEMQQTPPDILVTNFTMLEYMLLRNDDRRLFREPSVLKFLILDEVHSYRGTTGMEVATLLRRFRNYLERTANNAPVKYRCIGTSATLGTESNSSGKMAQFATKLFGAPIAESDIIVGQIRTEMPPSASSDFPADKILDGILGCLQSAPTLCRVFALSVDDVEDDDPEIPCMEWAGLADALHCPPIDTLTLASSGLERTEVLGRIVSSSPAFSRLQIVWTSSNGVVAFSDLTQRFWGDALASSRPTECRVGISRILQLVQSSRVNGEGLLAVRGHEFVREHRQAYVCIDPKHKKGSNETDEWWSELYVNHRRVCDTCGSNVYPLYLCRKCGFVVLEGWYRKKTCVIAPERDELLGKSQFRRILFRPLNALTERLKDRLLGDPQVNLISICTVCGLRFAHDNEEYTQAAIREHAKSCPRNSIIEAVEWAAVGSDVVLQQCPYCDQEWFSGQEVITPPTLSLYSAATIILEELKRAIDEPLQGTNSINKVLCFSDSRQQAAYIASRLQRTNEDFTFRQLIHSVLRDAHAPLSTRALVGSLTELLAHDRTLAALFCEPSEVWDDSLIKKRVATLLFRDTCTEFRTLESLGLVSVILPESLFARSYEFLGKYPFTRGLDPTMANAYTQFVFDWIFRFHRWALNPGPLQPLFAELERYGYYEKSIARLGGDQYSRTVGFSLRQENSRNRVYDFYKRWCKRESKPLYVGDLSSFKDFMESMWDHLFTTNELYSQQKQGFPKVDDKPFICVGGTDSESIQLRLNWLALHWKLEQDNQKLFRCDCCGFISKGSVRAICPIRDCSGTMQETSLAQLSRERFSPARHYLTLLKEKPPKPLVIEEHTAQISPIARRQIESNFRNDEKGSVDIISGSTTFELGIDLGIVNGVFLANMPPDVSNYRQRAGRAGRRVGMMPIVFTYVRQRPHDSYFWNKPDYFIAGPLRVPRFSNPSHEVLLRHTNAMLYAFLMQDYPTPTGLQGPTVREFLNFALYTQREETLESQSRNPISEISRSLKSVLESNPSLNLSPHDSVSHFYKRLRHFNETYSSLVSDDGTISTLSDYGILPSYNYPIYVDELRLYECPRTEWPRRDLKLQRDRSISLNEYYPGRIIIAGKVAIRSTGLWKGFKRQPFKYCKDCAYIDTRESGLAPEVCPNGCGPLISLTAVKPLGGFVGKVENGLARQDPDVFAVARSQYLFDPAGNPPPPLVQSGHAVKSAKQTSFNIEKSGARMRTFVPRPDSEPSLELAITQLRDVGVSGNQAAECLVVPSNGVGPTAKYFLMHEFTTDILRLQISESPVGNLLRSSPTYVTAVNTVDDAEKRKADSVWLYTFTQALAVGGSRLLQIDPREIAFTFRSAPSDTLFKREAILFDTAPGGAGYCDQLFGDLRALFQAAADVLECREHCGDSCYACLRSFDNQPFHSRLNRFFVLDGLKSFVVKNWPANGWTPIAHFRVSS